MQYPINYISIPQGFGNGHKGVDFGWYSVLHHHQPILAVMDGIVSTHYWRTNITYKWIAIWT